MDFSSEEWVNWTRLMARTQDGDLEAYARLLSGISPIILNYVRKRVFNPDHVDDVYQEVLMTFHKARHTYQTDKPFSPWLFTVVRNAVWSALKKRRRITDREVFHGEMPDIPARVPLDEELDDTLYKALNSLSEDQRRAVEMLKIRGMDLESAAKELEISVAALKVRAHRGYLQLRKLLMSEN